MLQKTKDAVIATLKLKKSMSELDISKAMKENFSWIEPSVTELEAEGALVVVGKPYSESLGKLFRVVTLEFSEADKMRNSLEKRQFSAQKKAMCIKLLGEMDEYKNKNFLSEALTLLRQSPQKISRRFFHLNNEEIIAIYENVLRKGHAALDDYEAKLKAAPLT